MGMDEAIAARIRMITETGDGLSGPDLLGFALDHAVTETGGLGGMVHLRGPGARSPRLTAVHGLIRPVARDLAEVEAADASAPARAMAQGTPVWAPALGTGDGTGPALPAGSGLLAVPLITPDGVTGALSVLMAPAERPAPRRWAAVEALAAWAAARLWEVPPDRGRDQTRNRDGTGTLLADDQVSQALSQLTADDAALLIVRTHALAPDHIAAWPLSEGPIAAGEARDHVRDQLTRWELAPLTPTAELLVSELVANAIRHGRGPVELRLLHGEGLICEVTDGSLTTLRIRHASETDEGGRGLQLVSALSHRWGTRYMPTGKCIWTEQSLP